MTKKERLDFNLLVCIQNMKNRIVYFYAQMFELAGNELSQIVTLTISGKNNKKQLYFIVFRVEEKHSGSTESISGRY